MFKAAVTKTEATVLNQNRVDCHLWIEKELPPQVDEFRCLESCSQVGGRTKWTFYWFLKRGHGQKDKLYIYQLKAGISLDWECICGDSRSPCGNHKLSQPRRLNFEHVKMFDCPEDQT